MHVHFGDHASLNLPAVGLVGEFGKLPLLDTFVLKICLRLFDQLFDLSLQPGIARQANRILQSWIAFTVLIQLRGGESAVSPDLNLKIVPYLSAQELDD